MRSEYYDFTTVHRTVGAKGEAPMRQIVITRGEDGFWVAECPSLPGCVTQGPSREEAIENARDAIEQYVAALEADHLPVPAETFETLVVAV